ncbi:GNAT family N-acetyltransferase [Candidatus Eisenbacteria bacterium]|uniref:GNAT family N-acetyltransferase n=1 Tax=Eiseniibacteriota bacterium TaxID=2212470 RepID=A0ABV6YIU4_UNCEI
MIRYPKVFRGRDGRTLVIRPATRDDIDSLLAFFVSLPEEDRLHLRVDVTQAEVMKRRMTPPAHWEVFRLIGLFGDKVVGEASIAHRTYGFETHVGEIRILVGPDFRSSGLGTFLGRQLLAHAIVMDLEKVEVEMMEDDERSVQLIEQLGFEREGVLKDFVKDIKGNNHDLLIMSLRT